MTGPAIAGQTPSGQGIGDQSQLTACGGFTVVRASVKKINLPNGTILWVTLGGEPIGMITLMGGAGSMASWTLPFSTVKNCSSVNESWVLTISLAGHAPAAYTLSTGGAVQLPGGTGAELERVRLIARRLPQQPQNSSLD